MGTFTWNTDGSTTVGNTVAESIDRSGLVPSGKTLFIVSTVDGNVFLMALAELLDGSFDVGHSTFDTHLLGGDVGVESRAVPVSWNWLGVERNLDAEFFGNTVEEVTSDPKMITHLNAEAWANLEFPLGWENFSVDTADLDTGVEACLIVGFYYIPTIDVAGANSAVVWSLWSWETALGPAVWPSIGIEEGIFLLKAEPWLVLLVGFHELVALVAVVVLVWGAIWVPGLAHDEDIGGSTDWIWEDCNWAEIDIGVVAGSLSGRGAVKVPFWEIFGALWLLEEGLGLGTEVAGGVNPDVFGQNGALLVKASELA